MSRRYVYRPVLLDRIHPNPVAPEPGTVVVLTQPPGCPRNGTMGHVYIADAATGAFYGLIHRNSLGAR